METQFKMKTSHNFTTSYCPRHISPTTFSTTGERAGYLGAVQYEFKKNLNQINTPPLNIYDLWYMQSKNFIIIYFYNLIFYGLMNQIWLITVS